MDEKFKAFRIKMDTLLEKGLLSSPLMVFHNRLLLEDVMAIDISQELVLLIHQTHKLVEGKNETWWSRRIKTIGDRHVAERLNYVVFQYRIYTGLFVSSSSRILNAKHY